MKKILTTLCFTLPVYCLLLTATGKAQNIFTIAGNGGGAYTGDGGQASVAQLWYPLGVTFDAAANLYIADNNNNVIRKINTTGIISTVAGNGTKGSTGDGGQATNAELNGPSGLLFDAAGNMYVAGFGSNIRKISTAGIISTIAGNATSGYSGDGGPATAAQLSAPSALAFDAAGNLFIADYINNRVRKISTAGIISTIAGNGTGAYSGDGGQATAAQLKNPNGIIFDPSGNLYIADRGNSRIRKINTSGLITTVAGNGTYGVSGDGGQATNAELAFPDGINFDAAGNLYIADYWSTIRKVNSAGIITTVAGDGGYNFSGDGGPALNGEFYNATGVVFDAKGNMYITDGTNDRIRIVTPATVTVSVNPTATTTCAGITNTLTVSGNAINYSWSPAKGLNASTGTTVLASPTVTTTYSVSGTTNYTMYGTPVFSSAMATSAITVPAITVNSPSICIGNTCTLTAVGANTYTWSTSENTSSITPSPTITTHYTVTGTDAHNCTDIATATITVNSLPSITIVSSPSVMCVGKTATLTASGASTYTWSPATTLSATSGASVKATPTVSSTYTITGKDVHSCINTAISTLSVNLLPGVTFDIDPGMYCTTAPSFSLNASPSGGNYSGTGVSGNQFDPLIAGAGTYTLSYTFTDGNNCTNTDTAVVSVQVCATGIHEFATTTISVYPNPAHTDLYLQTNIAFDNAIVEVYDIIGQKVWEEKLQGNLTRLSLGSLNNAIYQVRVLNNQTLLYQTKVVKQP